MGFFCGLLLVLAGGYYMLDAFMLFGRAESILQEDFVQSRLIGGGLLFGLGCLVFLLSSISESLGKILKVMEAPPPGAPAAAPVPAVPPGDAGTAAPRGWTCRACGKLNPSQAMACVCGASRP